MLRRFVPFRRMLAVALAGVALGACSDAAKDATAPATLSQPDLTSSSSRAFTLTSNTVSFTYDNGAFSPTTQTVNASGLIALAMGYVLIGKTQYQPSNVKDWLTVRMRPRGKVIEITFTPKVVPGVDLGGLTATVPISIPGASNNPQIITVSVGEVFGCPVKGSLDYPSNNNLVGDLQPGTTCQSEVLAGERVFDVYSLMVPANATFTVMMRARPSDPSGNAYPNPATTVGNLYDPFLFLVDATANTVVRYDDDCGRGFNSPYYDSRVVWTNPDAAPKKFYLLASQYSTSQFGTYTVDIYDGVFTPSYGSGYCTGYSPSDDFNLSPGAQSAANPMDALAQKYAREKQQH